MGEPANSLYTVRSPDGLELGPIRADTVLDLIKAKKITGTETVSRDGGAYVPIRQVEVFAFAIGRGAAAGVRAVSTDLGDLPGLEEEDEDEVDLDVIDGGSLEAVETESFSIDLEAPEGAPRGGEIELEEIEEIEELSPEGEAIELEVIGAAPAPAALSELTNPDNRYTIRDPDGLVLGPVRIATIRDLMDAGKVTRAYQIKKNNAGWIALPQVPELVYLLRRAEKAAKK